VAGLFIADGDEREGLGFWPWARSTVQGASMHGLDFVQRKEAIPIGGTHLSVEGRGARYPFGNEG
jgi:hypothetical protein